MDFLKFDAYVDAHKDEFLAHLTNLARIPSISAEGGPALYEAAAKVAELLGRVGLETEERRMGTSAPVIIGRGGSGARGLMIYNHYDVQPADPLALWETPPFEPQIRDGFLYARGVGDNKGNLVARIAALEAWQQTIGPLPLRILFLVEGEEEIGSPHMESFALANSDLFSNLDGCLWEAGYRDDAGRSVISMGLRGILSIELHVQTANSDSHSGQAGVIPNAPWRLVEALSTLRAPDGRITIDGLMDHVQPPTPEEWELLDKIDYPEAELKQRLGLRSFVGNATGRELLERMLFWPTCTINGLDSGYQGPGSKTVNPCHARAKLDLRLIPDLTPELTLTLLRDHLQRRGFDDVEVLPLDTSELPARSPIDHPFVHASITAVRSVDTKEPVVFPFMAGSGPMYPLCQHWGIPAVSFGCGHAGSNVHAPNENIRIEDFMIHIKVVGRLIERVGALE